MYTTKTLHYILNLQKNKLDKFIIFNANKIFIICYFVNITKYILFFNCYIL